MRLWIAAPLLCGIVTFAQVRGPAEGTATERRALPDRIYRDESLGLGYRLPEGYLANQDAVSQFVPKLDTRTLLVADQRSADKPCINRLVIMSIDTKHFDRTFSPRGFSSELLHTITSNPDVKLTHDIYQVQIAGKTFYRADFRKKLGCGVLHQSLLAVKVRHFMAFWTFACFTREELEQLVNSLQTISFEE